VPTNNHSAILNVQSINTYYGESHVLKDVSLRIDGNEVVSLIGRNGAGKTTTIRSIMGLTPPRDGRIDLFEQPIHGLDPFDVRRRGVSWVPEGRRMLRGLTVEENLRVAANPGQSEYEFVFDRFPVLADRRSQLTETLSGGEQQMLAIARALVGPETEILLLDEPSEGLAPQIQEDVQDIINEISDNGIPILIIEQNVDIALSLADRVYIMETGSIEFEGPAERLAEDEKLIEKYIGVH